MQSSLSVFRPGKIPLLDMVVGWNSVASDLGLHGCLCPTQWTLGLYGLRNNFVLYCIV